MVEKLKEYRAELEAKKAELEANGINNAEVEEKVNAYRQETIAEAQKELDDELNKIKINIDCINNLIAREEATAEAVVNEAE